MGMVINLISGGRLTGSFYSHESGSSYRSVLLLFLFSSSFSIKFNFHGTCLTFVDIELEFLGGTKIAYHSQNKVNSISP